MQRRQSAAPANSVSLFAVCALLLSCCATCGVCQELQHQLHQQLQEAPQSTHLASEATLSQTHLEPHFAEEPQNDTVLIGAGIVLRCVIEGSLDKLAAKGGRPTVTWLRDARLFTVRERNSIEVNDHSFQFADNNADQSLLSNASSSLSYGLAAQRVVRAFNLRIENARFEDDANYACIARVGPASFKSRTAHLTVLKAPTGLNVTIETAAGSGVTVAAVESPQLEQLVTVRLNSNISLVCRADYAKPQAELTWTDASGQLLPDNSPQLERRMEAQSSYAPLVASMLIFHVKASQELDGRQVTCTGSHPAIDGGGGARLLHRSVRFSIESEPDIHLHKEPTVLREGFEARFVCMARAKPAVTSYRWLLDGELLVGASGSELRISQLTRDLNGLKLSCEATNKCGTSNASLTLNVLYAPLVLANSLLVHNQRQQKQLTETRNELAAVVAENGSLSLQCAFDSNPRVSHVRWLKLGANKNTNPNIIASADAYNDLRNVTSAHASKLISRGALSVSFVASDVSTNDAGTIGGEQVDFEAMSTELSDELEGDARRASSRNTSSALIERLQQQQSTTMTTTTIDLPSLALISIEAPLLTPIGDDTNQTSRVLGKQLLRRQASVSVATLHLPNVKHDAVGRYVCVGIHTQQQQQSTHQQVQAARALFVALREQPRIVSMPEQPARAAGFGQSQQFDCLAQVNGLGESTKFAWFKVGSNEKIDPQIEQQFAISERQMSPDGLFARSILTVSATVSKLAADEDSSSSSEQASLAAAAAATSKYNCTVINQLGADHLVIELTLEAPQGFFVATMAAVSLASLGALVAVGAMLVACMPRASVAAQKKAAAAAAGMPPTLAVMQQSANTTNGQMNVAHDTHAAVSTAAAMMLREEFERAAKAAATAIGHSHSHVRSSQHSASDAESDKSSCGGCNSPQGSSSSSAADNSKKVPPEAEHKPSHAAVRVDLERRLRPLGQVAPIQQQHHHQNQQFPHYNGQQKNADSCKKPLKRRQPLWRRLLPVSSRRRPPVSAPLCNLSLGVGGQATNTSNANLIMDSDATSDSRASSSDARGPTRNFVAAPQASANGCAGLLENGSPGHHPQHLYGNTTSNHHHNADNYADPTLQVRAANAAWPTPLSLQTTQLQHDACGWPQQRQYQTEESGFHNHEQLASQHYQLPAIAAAGDDVSAHLFAAAAALAQHQQQPHQYCGGGATVTNFASLVAPVVGDDNASFNESNYGTLISRSTAFKKLGLDQRNNAIIDHQQQQRLSTARQFDWIASNHHHLHKSTSSEDQVSPGGRLTRADCRQQQQHDATGAPLATHV